MIQDKMYTEYIGDITLLAEKLNKVIYLLPTSSEKETMEETQIRQSICKAAEALNAAKSTIKRFSKNTRHGYLKKNFQGKFYIQFGNNEESYAFSCGNSIEVYLDENAKKDIMEGWHSGKVEYSDKYYFCGPGNPNLNSNMRARVRV